MDILTFSFHRRVTDNHLRDPDNPHYHIVTLECGHSFATMRNPRRGQLNFCGECLDLWTSQHKEHPPCSPPTTKNS